MKALLGALFLSVGLMTPAFATSDETAQRSNNTTSTTKRPVMAPQQVAEQLANFLHYPEVMAEGEHRGIVVVQFRLDDKSRVSGLEVFTDNRALNDDLTRQLTGKKLRLPQTPSDEVYTVRLSFRP